jgi:alpha/beta superfamily hydrolase
MVMKGQYLERATIIPSGELCLEGLFHRGHRALAALIVAPLAAGGSPMEVPQVAEVAWALHRAGNPTLRYNPRGFGASPGTAGGPEERLADARAALDSLAESAGRRVAVVGVQAGSETAITLAAQAEVAALVLVAPDPAGLLSTAVRQPAFAIFPGGVPAEEQVGSFRTVTVEEADAVLREGLSAIGRAVAACLDLISA